jgi:hypothetical protein
VVKRIMHPEVTSFDNELNELIDRWRCKPADDRLNVATVVGVLVMKAQELANEHFDYEDDGE